MIENILNKKELTLKSKITIKSLISFGIIGLAVLLPQLVHLIAGAQGGIKWLPMYLPVLLGGCLLGAKWGIAIGVFSPILSFLLTFATGNPMPVASRLPFMIVELAIFAGISGVFSNKIAKNSLYTLPAVIISAFVGRSVFLLLALAFNSITPFTFELVLAQVKSGLIALLLQTIIVFVIVALLKLITNKVQDKK